MRPGPARRLLTSVLVVLAAVLGACSGGSDTGAGGDGGTDGWIGAELGAVPDGLQIATVDERSGMGRLIAYGRPDAPAEARVFVQLRVPMSPTMDERMDGEGAGAEPGSVAQGVVDGHPATVRSIPQPDGGTGWEISWEPDAGLEVAVVDVRRTDRDAVSPTRESTLALAESVRSVDRARWEELMLGHERLGASPTTTPGAVEREIADGAVDGRQWTLSVIGDREGPAPDACFRLAYAGEDTGDGCAVERVVLSGKGFVVVALGESTDTGELRPGDGSAFDPIEPRAIAYGPDEAWNVAFAVLPDDTCAVDWATTGSVPLPLDLLPGDPGVDECVAG